MAASGARGISGVRALWLSPGPNAGLFEASLSYNLAASRQALTPERSACFAEIGIALYLKGDTDAARAHLGNKASRRLSCRFGWVQDCEFPDDAPFPTNTGYVAVAAGDLETAFRFFDRAVDEYDIFINQIRWQHPPSVALEPDPRYLQLLSRINLDDSWREELCTRARKLTRVTGIAVTCP